MAKKEELPRDIEGIDDLQRSPSRCTQEGTTIDAVFGEVSEDGPNYRNVRTLVPSLHKP
jgi:hypothetical protein